LKNFPNAACHETSSCANEASGLKVESCGIPLLKDSTLTLKDSNSMLVLTFIAPKGELAGDCNGKIVLNGIQDVPFNLSYAMPPAKMSPDHGSINGGSLVDITLKGWWRQSDVFSTPTPDTLYVSFGDLVVGKCIGSQPPPASGCIQSVGKSPDLLGLSLVVKVLTPKSDTVGSMQVTVRDRIKGVTKESRVPFVYFRPPQVAEVDPNRATLTGKTSASDGKTIGITLRDFPKLTSAGEFTIKFADVVCGVLDKSCGITEVKSLHRNGQLLLFLRIKVPPRTEPGDVTVSIEPLGQPEFNVQFPLSYYLPLPVVREAKWCRSCHGEASCIVMGKCGDGESPLESMVPSSGGGKMVVVIENPPLGLSFGQQTQTMVSLALGTSNFASFRKGAFGSAEIVAVEFEIPPLASPRGDVSVLTIVPKNAISPSVSSFSFTFFDDSISLTCLEGCQCAASPIKDMLVSITNLPLSENMALFDQILSTFGELESVSIRQERDHVNCTSLATHCFWLVVPKCDGCSFNRGSLKVVFSMSLKSDASRRAQTVFTYWSSPTVQRAEMDSMGTSINVMFDQDTNQAGMLGTDTNCSQILDADCIPLLATNAMDASCVWSSPDSLFILLGSGATISPGDKVRLRRNSLKSVNEFSEASIAETIVSAPEFATVPFVTISGSDSIDPCSSLELYARADSPRALSFTWSCKNDDNVNRALRTIISSNVFLASGTKCMQVLDKTYTIVVTATNFLGATSAAVEFNVLKKGSPAPLLTFDPPALSITRDQAALIKVVATFSLCPIEKGKLVFQWSLLSVSDRRELSIDKQDAFNFEGSQLRIAEDTLDAGMSYSIGVKAYMENDPSKTTESEYLLSVQNRPLVLSILGGTQLSATTQRALVLDATKSGDPDFHGGQQDTELRFVWSCSILDGSIAVPCRYKNGTLLSNDLTPQATVTLTQHQLSNLHVTGDNPYVFQVQMMKTTKTPVSFRMPVTLVEQAIPDAVATSASGVLQTSGIVRINPGQQFIVHGSCRVSEKHHKHDQGTKKDMQLKWTVQPSIPDAMISILPGVDSELISRETFVVMPDLSAFVAGSSYVVNFRCIDATDVVATSSVLLSVNSPPRGSACTACRLSGTVCSSSNPKSGDPIFDSFRYACPNWADEDGPLEYQFMYFGESFKSVAYPEVVFDWSKSPSVDLILPPGSISLKARVRDSFGASTKWMSYMGKLNVGASPTTATSRRHVLSAGEDRWDEAKTKVQESLDLADAAKTNQLAGALAIQIKNRVAEEFDDRNTAMIKKEFLLSKLRLAAELAIKTEGYVCEALSAAMAIGSEVAHINAVATAHISEISRALLASADASALTETCARDLLTLTGKAMGATFENRTCSNGHAVAPDYMRQFLTNMDAGLKQMLPKSSSSLLMGQSIAMEDLTSNSTGFRFTIGRYKMPLLSEISSELAPLHSGSAGFSFRFPSELQQDSRLKGQSSVNVLFGAFQRAPNMNGISTISPAVSLTLATENGVALPIYNLSRPINITIPVSTQELCSGAETTLYSGRMRCLHWDEASSSYHSDGCTAHQISATQVTCMCTHLTTFVIEPIINPPNCAQCESGSFMQQNCTSSSDRVCSACPANSTSLTGSLNKNDCQCKSGYSPQTGSECSACIAGKYKDSIGSTACTSCDAGNYSSQVGAESSTVCEDCPAYSTSAAGSSRLRQCRCDLGYTGPDGEKCDACVEGKYKAGTGDAACSFCPAQSNSPAQSRSSTACTCNAGWTGPEGGGVCTKCVAGTYKVGSGNSNCTRCPAHSDSYAGSILVTGCTCNTGSSGQDGGLCTACVQGTYKAISGMAKCQSCPAHSNSLAGSSNVIKCMCNAGYSGLDGGMCHACAEGKYKAGPGGDVCEDCGANTYLDSLGSTNASDCKHCGTGKYSDARGLASANGCKHQCGDGIHVAGNETCDDGNTTDGDGCSSTCGIEEGWNCTTSPVFGTTSCKEVCGNKAKTSGESCDDGNTAAGDGCSVECTVEIGYNCSGGSPTTSDTCSTTCGDGKQAGAEACDDSNTAAGDGCSDECAVECGFVCGGSAPQLCHTVCGDGIFAGNEVCDDNNTISGDGCNSTCAKESGWNCTTTTECGQTSCVAICGDGEKVGAERCDDGNTVSGDGCSNTCAVDCGYNCSNPNGADQASVCAESCGDSVVTTSEACDDGNSEEGDGCNGCVVEAGYACSNTLCRSSDCVWLDGNEVCGDGFTLGGELHMQNFCDDGNNYTNDGCSATCTVECGYTCDGGLANAVDVCSTNCSDRIRASDESCDDGNMANGDGCNSTCGTESGWNCTTTDCGQTTCVEVCGNSFQTPGEGCDDGNIAAGDGCSNECSTECGFVCNAAEPQVCVSKCGDGIRASDEACDDGNTADDDGCNSSCNATEPGWKCEAATDCQKTSCEQCTAGKFETGGVCQDCPAGTHLSTEGSSSSEDCIECEAGKYSNRALTACDACPESSNSAKKSATLTACTCNAGWTGPDGGPCQLEVKDPPSDVLPPDSPSATDVLVKMAIGLRISIAEFDNAKQLTFRQGIANAAFVAVGKVTITSIKTQTTGRRHLLADGIRIDVEVAAKDANAAASVAQKLSVENINAQLSKAGLPEAEVLSDPVVSEVLSVPIVSAAPPPPAESEGKSNDMTVIIAAVCAGVGAVVLGAGVCMYRRRRTQSKADLETEGVFPPRATNDLDTDTSGENHMPRLANNMPATQEAITDGNSTLESADSEQAHVGQYQPIDTHEVNLDSVVMNLLGNDPAAILSSPLETVQVRAYELIDFSAPADQVKSSIAQQIRNLNSDTNQAVRATAVHGFMARPMEQSSVMPSVSSSPLIPANAAA